VVTPPGAASVVEEHVAHQDVTVSEWLLGIRRLVLRIRDSTDPVEIERLERLAELAASATVLTRYMQRVTERNALDVRESALSTTLEQLRGGLAHDGVYGAPPVAAIEELLQAERDIAARLRALDAAGAEDASADVIVIVIDAMKRVGDL
jgi:hypothetical protein